MTQNFTTTKNLVGFSLQNTGKFCPIVNMKKYETKSVLHILYIYSVYYRPVVSPAMAPPVPATTLGRQQLLISRLVETINFTVSLQVSIHKLGRLYKSY